jgi:hypothetical protein
MNHYVVVITINTESDDQLPTLVDIVQEGLEVADIDAEVELAFIDHSIW